MPQSLYYWSGKRRLSQTVLPRKRMVPDTTGRVVHCSFDIRRWVLPGDDDVVRAKWDDFASRQQLLFERTHDRPTDAKAKAIWQFVVEQIRYARDEDGFDFWQLPQETLSVRRGDCEDKTFLAASLMLAAGLPRDRVRVVVGAMLLSKGKKKKLTGHAWPMYRSSQGTWCILETCLRHLPVAADLKAGSDVDLRHSRRSVGFDKAVFLRADTFAADGRRMQYVPLMCLNDRGVWTVEETRKGRLAGARRLHPDWSRKPTFRQLWKREMRVAGDVIGPESEPLIFDANS